MHLANGTETRGKQLDKTRNMQNSEQDRHQSHCSERILHQRALASVKDDFDVINHALFLLNLVFVVTLFSFLRMPVKNKMEHLRTKLSKIH